MFNSFKKFSAIYFTLMLIYLVSILSEQVVLHNTIKPLFMVLLMVFLHKKSNQKYTAFLKLIQFGLFFSWIGDIALMINKSGPFFLIGLGAFLIAHVGYSLGFFRTIKESKLPVKLPQLLLLTIPFLMVTVPFFLYIKDGLVFMQDGAEKNLTIPVLAYTVVISVMGMFSAWRYGHVNQKSFRWVLVGAILFILSDCVLALNIFSLRPQPNSDLSKALRIANMILYLSGQFMITVGAIFYVKSAEQKT